jgi:hypothetical protein
MVEGMMIYSCYLTLLLDAVWFDQGLGLTMQFDVEFYCKFVISLH